MTAPLVWACASVSEAREAGRNQTIVAGKRPISRIIGLLLPALLAGASSAPAQTSRSTPPSLAPLSGDIAPVHDPAILRQGNTWYLFTTSQARDGKGLIHIRTSKDLASWTRAAPVFAEMPAWVKDAVPGAAGIWAPDVQFLGGEYRVYYSVSTFGKNRSAIGLVTTPSLEKPVWTDKGLVLRSDASDDFNAIDPNAFADAEGRQWLAFGSFWSGLKMVRLDPKTGLRSAADAKVRAIARRPSPGAIEAPFVIRRGGYYYLFASFDFCCRRSESTYYTVVGRAKDPKGPYLDREGKRMLQGGGLRVLHADLDAARRFVGPGHVAILREPKRDYIVYHAYDTQARGVPTLRIQPLGWTDDGWPVAL
ncbi:arabinan endo-1,5-alpha-L-arabinosidase [Sphingomonas sp. DG1-23]|uniref:arabinan endo-1,5-alpha-L-arabinosidase n=1 Tax=Sphingomonas sp. DG1-23 TaxID=3068316 RepID=UPI00273E7C9B|nr:arabinan endo-1,5-alpha-L-arabinosidase [Sphingomonas sp. DG1-23]MDP5280277.1 arabinan endo-1,5-alpha-L-arabinosidase [Sphingomonas sp. DG1-23]